MAYKQDFYRDVDDLIQEILWVMGYTPFLGPINLGSFEKIAIAELPHLILQPTRSSSSMQYESLLQVAPPLRCPLTIQT